MNSRTFKLASFLMVFPFAITVATGGEKSKSRYVQVTQQNLYDMIMKMSDHEVGRVLVQKQDLLGGDCRVTQRKMGPVLYTLEVPGAAPKKFGLKKGNPVTKVSLKEKKITSIFSIFKKQSKPKFTYPERTNDEIAIARKEMGAAFKSEIADRSWPCGAVQMESHRISLEELKEEVEFYKDQDTKKIVCVSPNGKKSQIRKPNSCEFEPILEVLPQKLCDYLAYLAQSDAEDELVVGTRVKVKTNPKKGEEPTIKFSISRTKPLTREIRRKVELSRAIVENPEVVLAVNADHVPTADDFLSEDTINQIEGKVESVDSFEEFSDEAKIEFVKLALSVRSVTGDSEYVQPSKDLADLVDEMGPQLDAFITENPNMEVDLHDFPKVKEVEEAYSSTLNKLSKITEEPYNVNLKCYKSSVKPRRFDVAKQVRDVFKKPINKSGNSKLKLKDGRFIGTRL